MRRIKKKNGKQDVIRLIGRGSGTTYSFFQGRECGRRGFAPVYRGHYDWPTVNNFFLPFSLLSCGDMRKACITRLAYHTSLTQSSAKRK
jgi:hypothetical protein